jgi:hypothetical protein
MTLEQLDAVRGYAIAAIILAVVALGASALIPAARIQQWARTGAALVGGVAALSVFFLFTFIGGWDEYLAAKAAGRINPEYHGRHQAAALMIRTLGEMEVSALGLLFGALGLVLLAVALVQIRAMRTS